jgi:hypothetical protein
MEGKGGREEEDNFRKRKGEGGNKHGCGHEGYGSTDIYQELGGWKRMVSTNWLMWAKLLDDFKDRIVYVALDVV